jgi:hypothetical protein
MTENELERDLAADMPLSDEDAEAVVGGSIVHTYVLPGPDITVDRQRISNQWVFTFKSGSTTVTTAQAKAAVTGAGQEWIPTRTWSAPPGLY